MSRPLTSLLIPGLLFLISPAAQAILPISMTLDYAPTAVTLHLPVWRTVSWPWARASLADPLNDPEYRVPLNATVEQFRSAKNRRFRYLRNLMMHPRSERTQADVSRLALSERYDLLTGSTDFALTNGLWDYAIAQRATYEIPLWSGICDGWALAALHHSAPEHGVEVTGPLGHLIRFEPQEIEGLLSLAWTLTHWRLYSELGEGRQCARRSGVERGIDYRGQPISAECRDPNPSIFHRALLEWVGHRREGFILDAANDGRVFNEPVTGYTVEYIDPRTGLPKQHWEDAARPVTTSSRARSYPALTAQTVQIRTTVWTLPEGPAATAESQSTPTEYNRSVFHYSLDLDAAGNILDGEWHNPDPFHTLQPDVFWMAEQSWLPWAISEHADTSVDEMVHDTLVDQRRVPLAAVRRINQAARRSSVREGIPELLYSVVGALAELSGSQRHAE